MNQKALLFPLLAALCSLFPFNTEAYAADAEERQDVYTLGEVVVYGKQSGVQTTQTIHIVTAEDIRSSGAKTLEQAIALLPGVNVRTGGEGVPRIDIRGFRTRHVILLLDGIPMNSAFDQQFDPTIIPTENIAEIKLTSGASSVLYGQGGLGGVINIITKKGITGVQGMVAGETGDHAPYRGRGSISGATDRFNFFLSGSATKMDGYPLSGAFKPTSEQGAGYRSNSDKVTNNLFGTVGFTPNSDVSFGLTFNVTQGSYGKTASTINDPFGLDPFASPPKYVRVDKFSGLSLQLAADYTVTDQLNLRGWAFINRFTEHLNQYDSSDFNSFNRVAGSFQEQVVTSVKGITVQPRYVMGDVGVIRVSLAAEGDSWENSGPLTVAPDTYTPLEASKSLALYSASLEYELSPLPGLGLVAGYGHYLHTRDELRDNDYSLLAGASYDISEETRLKASFKRSIRFPALGDLYALDKGNPNLAGERACSYEAGIEQKLPLNSSLGLTGFYTVANNLIQNDQTSGKNTNLAEVRLAGVELSATAQFIQNLSLRASYAHLYSEDRSRAGRDQQQYTPGDKASLEGKYDFASGFSPCVSVLYVGNQYFYTKNNVTPVQKGKLNDYTLVAVKLSQKVWANKATLSIGVNNLFDVNYETSYGFPQAGRFIYGGIEFRI
ncbi:MAG: TonB-dependent receptor [Pelobacteraceae bacterium]